MFKFSNDTWKQVSIDSPSPNGQLQFFSGFSDNKILYSGKSGLYYFNESKWDMYINFENNLSSSQGSCGRDANSVLFKAVENNFNTYLYYYDGKQFYRNSNLIFPYLGFMGMQYKFGRYYISIDEDWMGNSYLATSYSK